MAHNISETEIAQAVQALRAKGIPDHQIEEVIGAMSYGESADKAQRPSVGRDAASLGLMASGNPVVAAIMMANRQPEMSQTDGVTRREFEPDVIGAYVDADQKLQDVYAQSAMAQRQMNTGMQGAPVYYSGTADMNVPPVAITNPNMRVEEPRRTTVDSAGNIVIY